MQQENLISAKDFCTHHHIEISFIQSLNHYGLIEMQQENDEYLLQPDELDAIEKMMRMHYDLHVNFEGIDVIQNLLEKMDQLQREIMQVKNRLRIYEPE